MKPKAIILKEGIVFAHGAFEQLDVKIERGLIIDIAPELPSSRDDFVIDASGYCILPGLINSHDHLEFNLYPRLGKPPYKNYVEWADDVQKNYQEQIRPVLQIPLKERLLWGAYKNLFSGVTTVFHHNSFHPLFRKDFPVYVFDRYTWIHSLELDEALGRKLRLRDGQLCAIHVAEGVDEKAFSELQTLDALGGLTERTIVVHGIALSDSDLERMKVRKAGLVWCPSSNIFLFGRTAPVEKLVGHVPVALGSDSTISGGTSLLADMQLAHGLKGFSMHEVVEMVTRIPAKLLEINKGEIEIGRDADLLLFRPQEKTDPLFSLLKMKTTDLGCVVKNGLPVVGGKPFQDYFAATNTKHVPFTFGEVEILVPPKFPLLLSRLQRSLPGERLVLS